MIIYVFTALGTEFNVLMNSRILRFLVRLLYVFILKKKKNTCYILCSILCEFSNFERWVNYDPPFPKRTHVPFAYKKYRETFVVICICMELFRYFSFRYILTQPVYILKCLYILFFAQVETANRGKLFCYQFMIERFNVPYHRETEWYDKVGVIMH